MRWMVAIVHFWISLDRLSRYRVSQPTSSSILRSKGPPFNLNKVTQPLHLLQGGVASIWILKFKSLAVKTSFSSRSCQVKVNPVDSTSFLLRHLLCLLWKEPLVLQQSDESGGLQSLSRTLSETHSHSQLAWHAPSTRDHPFKSSLCFNAIKYTMNDVVSAQPCPSF